MKKKWFKNIMKIIGISMASVFGFIGLSIGVFALFGGFNEKIVKLQGMQFEQNAYVLDGNIHNENGIFDDSIKILPTNEDANQLDITLSGGANIVTLPTGKDSQVNKNLNLKLTTITDNLNTGSYTYNKGGEFTLKATQEKTLLTTSTKVFVESKISSFNLTDNLNNSLIYPGSKFNVSGSNILPTNAFDRPTSSEFYLLYGENYFKKTFLYFSSNESIATVDMYTGEVEVLTEGNFTIFAYVPTTYENNSLLPNRNTCNSDSEFFSLLEEEREGLPFTIKSEISYTSNPISVNGITASTNVFELFVNQDYKYAIDGNYNSQDNQLNLNFNLIAPSNSNYTSEQLAYKLQDIEIFEGYKENNNYYISAGQTYDEETQTLKTTYFDIKQNKKPLYYSITPRDYTYSKDLYLIVRIANTKLNLNNLSTNSILATDVPVETNEDYVYYAFVKVNTNIVENTALNLTTDKIMASFTKTGESDYLYINDGALLNLNDLISNILPENATYKNVRFYVRNNGTEDNPIILANEETDEIEFQEIKDENDNVINSGYFVKALNEGTLQFYASIVKTDRNGENPVKLFNSNDITLIVTQEINLTNFKIDLSEKDKFDATLNKYLITKGNNLTITFETDNINGLKRAYQEGFFNVTSSIENRVAINIDLNNATLNNENGLYTCTIVLTATFEGETTININFNGKNINFTQKDDDEQIIDEIPLKLLISNNDLKSINLISADGAINSQNQINFEVNGDLKVKDLQFIVKNTSLTDITSTGTKPLNINIELNGGNDNTELLYYTSNNTDLDFAIKDNVLQITPKKVCENVEFYVYSMVGGNMIKSSTYKINVTADYIITPNRINEININSITYEKVIGGENFNLVGDNAFLSINASNKSKFNPALFEIKSSIDENGSDIYKIIGSSFIDVQEPTTCIITVTPKFANDAFNFYFYVIPKFTVSSETLEINTGATVNLSNIDNNVTLLENKYAISDDLNSSNPIVTKIGEIYSNLITLDLNSVKFYSDEIKTTEITSYTASIYAFDNTKDVIYLSVNYNNQNYNGEMNVVINSNIEIQNSKTYLNNGETILLSNLFKIINAENTTISDVNIVFDENTFNSLILSGIKLLDKNNENINQYLNSFEYDLQNKIYVSLINSLFIPTEFNILSLKNLNAYVTCKINDNLTIKENHAFNLDFQITTIELDETNIIKNESKNIIYLESTNKTVDYIKENFVKIATVVNKITDSPKDEKGNVEIVINNDNTATISLNNVVLTLEIKTLTINKALNDEDNKIVRFIGKAYSFEDLISIDAPNLQDKYSYCNIVEITKDDTTIINVNYSIENNRLIIKTAGSYKIVFNVLGNKTKELSFTFNDIELESNLENCIETVSEYKIYSKISYDLFNNETIDILENENISYTVDVLNLDDTIFENANVVITNNQLQIGNYKGNLVKFKLKFTFNTILNTNEIISFTGATKEVVLELNSLFVTTNFVEVYNGRQVLMNYENYDLSKYFTINSSDESLYDTSSIDLNNFNFYIEDKEITNKTTTSLNYSVAFDAGFNNDGLKDFDLIIKNNDKVIGVIPFSSEYVKLSVTNYTLDSTPYFIGQTLYRKDLLNLVKVLDYNDTVITKYNNNITFNGKNYEEEFSIKLTGQDTVEVNLGQMSPITCTIISNKVNFEYDNKTISIYTDTKVSNYISANYRDKNLILNYKASSENDYIIVDDKENQLQKFMDGDTLIASLNTVTGELTVENIKNRTFKQIIVTAYIVNAETQSEEIYFGITEITKTILNDNPTIYIGDNTTDLQQFVYFGNKLNKLTSYEFSDLIYDNNYTYYYNKNEIVRNGNIVAGINANELTIKNSLDTMIVKVKAFINVSNSSGYKLESLRNNDIEITINFVKIEVSLNNDTITYNSNNYYVLNTYKLNDDNTFNQYLNNIEINPLSNLEETIYLDDFKFSNAFIGIVNDTIITKQLEIEINESGKITLPTLEEITITKNNNIFSLNLSQSLSCYVFCTFTYKIGSYTNNFNIVLKPYEEDIITFNYNDINTAFKTIVSPSEYVLTNGSVFTFSSGVDLSDISFLYLNTTGEINADYIKTANDFSDHYTYKTNNSSFVNTLTYNNTISGIKLILESGEQEQNLSHFYCIKINNNDKIYYYIIKVENVLIEIKNNEYETNSITNRINLGSEITVDLKDYIYINSLPYEQAVINNPDFINNLIFNDISNEFYSVSSNGILTPKNNVVGNLDLSFSFYGIAHNIYLKGESININFKYNNEVLNEEDNLILGNGNKYYIYLIKTQESETNILNVNISETNIATNALDGSLTFLDFKYIYGGQEYNTTSETFEINDDGNKLTVKFGGLSLLILENKTTYYLLTLTENIAGNLSFNLNALYSGVTSKKLVNVTSDEIIINYIEPSIVTTEESQKEYQNMLSNSSLNLSNFITGIENKDKLTFELNEIVSNVTLTNAGILTANSDIYTDLYLEILVKYNNLEKTMQVRVIPEFKYEFANLNRKFNILGINDGENLNSETIDLTKYAKAYKFIGVDAKNEPLYEQIFNYKLGNEIDEITNFNAYKFSNESNLIKLNDFWELTFNVVELDLSSVITIYIGENLNLKTLIQNKVNLLTFNNVKLLFSDNDNFVSSDGMFLANQSKTCKIKALINNLEHEIIVDILDLSIQVNYTQSALIKNNNQPIKYQNVYATQILNLNDFINVVSSNSLEDLSSKSLQLALEVVSSNGYDISNFNYVLSEDTIHLYNNGTLLLSVNNEKLICYNSLSYEILLKIKLSIKDNSKVENVFNVRLLPAIITLTNGPLIEIDNTMFYQNNVDLLNNFITCNTKADSLNLNLNDKLIFKTSVDTQNLQYCNKNMLSIEAFNINNKISVIAILTDAKNIENGNIIDENLAIRTNFDLIYSNTNSQINYQYNPFTLNDSEFLTSGQVTSIRDYIDDTNSSNNNYILVTKVENQSEFYFDIFNSFGENLIQINLNGTYILKTSKEFTICIEAYGSNQTICLNKTFNSGITTHTVDYEKVDCKTKENGVTVLELISNSKLNITEFLNGGIILDECVGVAINSVTENNIVEYNLIANNVDVITYGYFDVQFGNETNITIQRIYVKIYPYQFAKLYTEDYTYNVADVELNGIIAIKKDSNYKTIMIYDEMDINLNDYVKLSTEITTNETLHFSIENIVAYKNDTYSFVEDENYCELNNNILILKPNGTYYVKVKASFNNDYIYLLFRILEITDDINNTINVTNGNVLDLTKMINVFAQNDDAGYNGLPVTKYNLFSNLNFKLTNFTNSYINNGYLYIHETTSTSITLSYEYNNLSSSLEIIVNDKVYDGNIYNLNGIKYVEKDYSNELLNIGSISNVSSVIFNDSNYDITIETKNEGDSENPIIVKYFVVNNVIKIKENGEIYFYNPNSNKFTTENNLGVILVTVIQENSGILNVENYKFNNYSIYFENGSYLYKENGQDMSSYLKFSLVDTYGLSLQNSIVNDNYITANGVTLNTLTGEILGIKSDDTIKMYLKVYVQENSFNYGEKFKLYEI